MSSTHPEMPSAELLPSYDPLIEAVRRGLIVACEQAVRGDALYVLGAAPGGAAWVFVHRSGETQVMAEVDDPRSLFAGLAIEDGPVDPLARLAFEQSLHSHYYFATQRRLEEGEPPPGALTALGAQEAMLLASSLARGADQRFPAPLVDPGAHDLEQLLAGPTASAAAPAPRAWTERPLGHVRDDALHRVRTQSLVEAFAADLAADRTRDEAAEMRRRAGTGDGPAARELGNQRQHLRDQAAAELSVRAQAVSSDRPATDPPAPNGPRWRNGLPFGTARRSAHPPDPAPAREAVEQPIGTADARAGEGSARSADHGAPASAVRRLADVEENWEVLRQEAVAKDVAEAGGACVALDRAALESAALATTLRDQARSADAELGLRAALPSASAASERLARELIASRPRPRPDKGTGRGSGQRQVPPPYREGPGAAPGLTP